MKCEVMQASPMGGSRGDIFWDLSPWLVYTAGYDIGCSICVANPTDTSQEYSLMARLTNGTTVISEEILPVFGHAWFTVEPGDFVQLRGSLRFDSSDAVLTVQLIERETEEVIDSVATVLIAPSTSTAALPPAWPGNTTTTTTDWSSLLGMILPVLMLGIFGAVIVTALKSREPKILPERS